MTHFRVVHREPRLRTTRPRVSTAAPSKLRPSGLLGSAFLVAALAASGCAGQEPIDLLFYNGKVFTAGNESTTWVAGDALPQAIAVNEGRVVAVGGNDLRQRYRAAREEDLGGRLVLPGFIDSHTHIDGEARRHVPLEEVPSLAELLDRVSAKAAELGPGEWITGYGWSEDEMTEERRPLRSDLDLAAPDNPVILTRAGGHSAAVNSLALDLAGIDRNTPDPEGGVIERDNKGKLNGVIRERQEMVGRLVPKPSPEEIAESLRRKLRDQFRLGITSLVHASATPEVWRIWQQVYGPGDALPRAAVQILWEGTEKMAELVPGSGDQRLRLGAAKIFVDGGFTGPAAYTLEPYRGQPQYRGKLNLSEQDLRTALEQAHAAGWQLGIHAIGDAAIALTVDQLAAILDASPRDDHRHYLNHFTVIPPAATMDQMAAHAIAITQQPNFTYTLEGRYVAHLDGERLRHNNPLRTPMEHGIHLAISSDILPIGPMVGLYAAVTRKGRSGMVYGEEERLTVAEALRAYTLKGAFLTFEETEKGSIEPGKLADLIVLSDDLLSIDPERILEVEVEQTYLGGELVYSSDS